MIDLEVTDLDLNVFTQSVMDRGQIWKCDSYEIIDNCIQSVRGSDMKTTLQCVGGPI